MYIFPAQLYKNNVSNFRNLQCVKNKIIPIHLLPPPIKKKENQLGEVLPREDHFSYCYHSILPSSSLSRLEPVSFLFSLLGCPLVSLLFRSYIDSHIDETHVCSIYGVSRSQKPYNKFPIPLALKLFLPPFLQRSWSLMDRSYQ